MIIKDWVDVWFDVAIAISKRSKCFRAQVGAVIVNSDNRIVSTGYNGPAAGFQAYGNCLEWCDRAKGLTGLGETYEGCPSIHAEANALLYVDRSVLMDSTIFITAPPCMSCAKLISNSGIKHVRFLYDSARDDHRNPSVVFDYLKKCGLNLYEHDFLV